MKLYRVSDAPTLHGEPAGPDVKVFGDNYLSFLPGDIVVVERHQEYDDRVVEAVRLSDGLPQSVDFSSLEVIGKGLNLTHPDFEWVLRA